MKKFKKSFVATLIAFVMAFSIIGVAGIDVNAEEYGEEISESKLTDSYWSKFSAPYYDYVDNFSNAQKKLYDELYSTLYNMIDGGADCAIGTSGDYVTPAVSTDVLTDLEIINVTDLIIIEHPELYFIDDETFITKESLTDKNIQFKVYEEFATGVQRTEASAKIREKIDWYLVQVNASAPYDIEKQIHDLICSNVSYSSSAPYLKSIASALLTDTAIGAGYAETFALLCYAKGLPVITVTSRIHEWNQVKLGDYWYAVDVMADDDVNIDYDYFNKSDSTIRSYSPLADALHTPKLAPWSAVGRPNCNKDYEGGTTSMPVYRLYNPNSSEHFYTTTYNEKVSLEKAGWKYEGIAWNAPIEGASDIPVYRMYNPNSGEHHYTKSLSEKKNLITLGWQFEGVNWCSDVDLEVPLYRLYNPNATVGAHHYTISEAERENLEANGWIDEGIAWYGVR
ncbi:MAG: hypothetical protein K5644_07640 [Lachnospiraceae bacterium]|nr:hypothetical protein [Lachnospiraceae bacterium]